MMLLMVQMRSATCVGTRGGAHHWLRSCSCESSSAARSVICSITPSAVTVSTAAAPRAATGGVRGGSLLGTAFETSPMTCSYCALHAMRSVIRIGSDSCATRSLYVRLCAGAAPSAQRARRAMVPLSSGHRARAPPSSRASGSGLKRRSMRCHVLSKIGRWPCGRLIVPNIGHARLAAVLLLLPWRLVEHDRPSASSGVQM